MVAVIMDQALRVAVEVAFALKAGIEIVNIGLDAGRDTSVDDLEARAIEVDAGAFGRCMDQVFAAEQYGGAKLLIGV